MAYVYYKDKQLPTVITRLFNTVGPRQTGHYGMVIPCFVNQGIRGEPITVYGDRQQTRRFCYVGDVVRALVDLVDQPEARGIASNLAGREEPSVEELAHRVVARVGSDSKVRYVPYEEGFEDMARRLPNTTRAYQMVGFPPALELDKIIDLVAENQRR